MPEVATRAIRTDGDVGQLPVPANSYSPGEHDGDRYVERKAEAHATVDVSRNHRDDDGGEYPQGHRFPSAVLEPSGDINAPNGHEQNQPRRPPSRTGGQIGADQQQEPDEAGNEGRIDHSLRHGPASSRNGRNDC